jgi:hypothetical protein
MSYEDFKDYIIFNDNSRKDDSCNWHNVKWRQEDQKKRDKTFWTPLNNFLKDLLVNKQLEKVIYGEGHNSFFSNAWNQLIVNGKFIDNNELDSTFYQAVNIIIENFKDEPLTEDFIKNKYEKFTQRFTQGNFANFELGSDVCKCHECGQSMLLNFKDWQPSYQVFKTMPDGTLNYKELVPPKNCLDKSITELKVNFPTGELLIADWFRIPEFTDTVEYNGEDKYSQERSINYATGRVKSTTDYAEKFNFISVSVGNSSPRIFKQKNTLVFGRGEYDEEKDCEIVPKNFVEKGYVCTDLWAVTIIDKQTLIDIVSKAKGEDATEIVEGYLQTEYGGNTIKVKPGEYTFKFHGNYYEFDKYLNDDNAPKDVEKFLIVSKSEVPLDNKKKNKP